MFGHLMVVQQELVLVEQAAQRTGEATPAAPNQCMGLHRGGGIIMPFEYNKLE
jgi:hypothetical protein